MIFSNVRKLYQTNQHILPLHLVKKYAQNFQHVEPEIGSNVYFIILSTLKPTPPRTDEVNVPMAEYIFGDIKKQ